MECSALKVLNMIGVHPAVAADNIDRRQQSTLVHVTVSIVDLLIPGGLLQTMPWLSSTLLQSLPMTWTAKVKALRQNA